MDFRGRTVMVTGAAGTLGRAVAHAFGEAGADRVLLDRDAAALREAFGDDGESQLLLAPDLRDRAQVEAAVARALARFGRIDALCNLAGGFRMGEPVHATSDATWDWLFDLNVRSLRNACAAVLPGMLARGSGKVVNVGAFSAGRGAAQMGAYTAAKAVVQRLTESMAAELREQGVNVNCVLPTIIDTPQNRADMPKADPARWVAPADLASVVVFLCSDAARAVHGASVPVCGLS